MNRDDFEQRIEWRPADPTHPRFQGGFESDHGRFRALDRVEVDGQQATLGEVLHDGDVDVHFDDGSYRLVKWRQVRPASPQQGER